MDDNSKKSNKRKSKFIGKEDISREIADSILTNQIDQLREISEANKSTSSKIRESIDILYNKSIPIDTDKLEQLQSDYINEIENKLRKIKQPSRVMKWYILMWTITLLSAFTAGYYNRESRMWKEKAEYWYGRCEEIKEQTKSKLK